MVSMKSFFPKHPLWGCKVGKLRLLANIVCIEIIEGLVRAHYVRARVGP